jgi:hypothetical protein
MLCAGVCLAIVFYMLEWVCLFRLQTANSPIYQYYIGPTGHVGFFLAWLIFAVPAIVLIKIGGGIRAPFGKGLLIGTAFGIGIMLAISGVIYYFFPYEAVCSGKAVCMRGADSIWVF